MTADALVFTNVGTIDTKWPFNRQRYYVVWPARTNAALKVETVQFADGFSANPRITNLGLVVCGGADDQRYGKG